jgi:hypothetical protein
MNLVAIRGTTEDAANGALAQPETTSKEGRNDERKSDVEHRRSEGL